MFTAHASTSRTTSDTALSTRWQAGLLASAGLRTCVIVGGAPVTSPNVQCRTRFWSVVSVTDWLAQALHLYADVVTNAWAFSAFGKVTAASWTRYSLSDVCNCWPRTALEALPV